VRPALLDDGHLRAVLRGIGLADLDGRDLFTTGSWYVRLCQAVLGGRRSSGILSGPLASLPDGFRSRALAAVMQLPDAIGLVSLRELAPVMGQLRQNHSFWRGAPQFGGAVHVTVEAAASGMVEADDDGVAVDLVDGAGLTLAFN